jgi:hypothetical protein
MRFKDFNTIELDTPPVAGVNPQAGCVFVWETVTDGVLTIHWRDSEGEDRTFISGVADPSSDGKTYGRKDGAWSEIVASGGGITIAIFDWVMTYAEIFAAGQYVRWTAPNWRKFEINHTHANTITSASIDTTNKQFTLPAGKYTIEAVCTAYGAYQLRVRNITDTATSGASNFYNFTSGNASGDHSVNCYVELAGAKTFEFQIKSAGNPDIVYYPVDGGESFQLCRIKISKVG